jgi:hypothetical protein
MMSHGGLRDWCGSVEVYSIGALGGTNSEHAVETAASLRKT